jgi:Ca2+-binding RTX toxin-like protein
LIANVGGYITGNVNIIIDDFNGTDTKIDDTDLIALAALTSGSIQYFGEVDITSSNIVNTMATNREIEFDFTYSESIASFNAANDVIFIGGGVSAADVTVSQVGATTLSYGEDTLTLTGYTTELDGSAILFNDGSVLKTNLDGSTTLTGTNIALAGDQLIAGNSGDILRGYAGDDLLIGGTGNDYIYGGTGDDIIIGGAGNDYLRGDAGADIFVYNGTNAGSAGVAVNGKDIIVGFQDGIDLIAIDTAGDGVGAQSAFANQTEADNYYSAVQSGVDTLINLYAGDASTVVGSIRLMNFTATDINYNDFLKV